MYTITANFQYEVNFMKKMLALMTAIIISASFFGGCAKSKQSSQQAEMSVSETLSSSSESTDDSEQSTETSESESESEEESITETSVSSDSSHTSSTEKKTDVVKADAQKSASKATSDVILNIVSGNTWDGGKGKYTQLDAKITNNGSSEISGWTAEITVPAGTGVDQIWNGSYKLDGTKLTITPADYNSKISAGGNVTFGLIVTGKGVVKPSASKLVFGGKSVNGSSSAAPTQTNQPNNTQNNQNNNKPAPAKNVPTPTTDDWLFTKGNKIVDKNGKEVWLTGVNWFGYNTGTNTFDGLWAADLNTSIKAIADHGFNLIRVPMSSELILQWADGKYPTANFNQATNSYLVGMNSLEIWDYVVGQCRANGIKIMVDIHCAKTDAMGHMKPVWYEGNITEKDYLKSLSWMAERYKNDDAIIAFDLKNEPHGKPNETPHAIWNNSTDPNNWKYIAEKAANAVLSKNPNVLVMVEGIEIYPKDIKTNGNFKSTSDKDYYYNWWGGNLRGVKDYPINLGKYQNKLVYSPHDYGPAVYQQPWFKNGYTFDSLYKDCWKDNWMFIYENKTAPLLIGEWGGYMTEPNLTWMTYMRKLIKDNKLNHTFWCFNANSGDTGGLVKDDFTTWDEQKYNFVKEVLWQKNGKFVGLDHGIPLGSNGISLSQY